MTEKVLKTIATLGTLGLGGYLAKKWYEGKLDEAKREGEYEARNAKYEESQKARQEEMEKDSEIINQSSHAKGRRGEFEGFTLEGFESMSEPKWSPYMLKALSGDSEDLIEAYSKRYGYKDAYLLGLNGISWRGDTSRIHITWIGMPRMSCATILHNYDILYKLARESYLIGCKDIAELMELKKAMDSWYLTQRARFLEMYDVSGWHYLQVCEQHYFRAHIQPHTLLELEIKRERDRLVLGARGNEASEELRQKFFTNAMALYELKEAELASRRSILYGEPKPLEAYKCWLHICEDIWEDRDFLASIEWQRHAQSEAESKKTESQGDLKEAQTQADSITESKAQDCQVQDSYADTKEDTQADSKADTSAESSADSKNAQGKIAQTKALDTLSQSLIESYCQRRGIESEASKSKE